MRILLDHCVDWHFARALPEHQVKTTAEMGWEFLKNGELLARAAEQFDLFVTVDKNLRYQQNLEKLPLPVLELNAGGNRLKDLEPLVSFLPQALEKTAHHRLVSLAADGGTVALCPRTPETKPRAGKMSPP